MSLWVGAGKGGSCSCPLRAPQMMTRWRIWGVGVGDGVGGGGG
jgi:hypothetical protein